MILERVQADASITDYGTSSVHRGSLGRLRLCRAESVNGLFSLLALFRPASPRTTRYLTDGRSDHSARAAADVRCALGRHPLAGGCAFPGAF
jgi:hypothetical protein